MWTEYKTTPLSWSIIQRKIYELKKSEEVSKLTLKKPFVSSFLKPNDIELSNIRPIFRNGGTMNKTEKKKKQKHNKTVNPTRVVCKTWNEFEGKENYLWKLTKYEIIMAGAE